MCGSGGGDSETAGVRRERNAGSGASIGGGRLKHSWIFFLTFEDFSILHTGDAGGFPAEVGLSGNGWQRTRGSTPETFRRLPPPGPAAGQARRRG